MKQIIQNLLSLLYLHACMHTGPFDEARKEEAEIILLLESGKAKLDEATGVLTSITLETEGKDATEEKTTKGKRKRKLIKQQPKAKKSKTVDTKSKKKKNSKEVGIITLTIHK